MEKSAKSLEIHLRAVNSYRNITVCCHQNPHLKTITFALGIKRCIFNNLVTKTS